MAMIALDLDQARRFLEHFRPDGYTTFVGIVPDGSTVAATFNGADPSDAVKWIAGQNRARNIYFTCNPTSPDLRKKPHKEDITEISAVWADIDPLDGNGRAWTDERERLETLADELHAIDTPPSFIVDSGNGIQPIWLLADPIEANAEYRQAAEGLCAQIEAALGARGTHNVDRLLRMPGTRNFPNAKKRALGRGETQARLLRWTWRHYSWTDLEQLAEHLRCNPPRHAVPCEPPRPRASLGDILPDDAPEPLEAERLAELREQYPGIFELARYDGDQSRQDLALAGLAARLGWSQRDAWRLILTVRADRKGGRVDYIRRTVARAYQDAAPEDDQQNAERLERLVEQATADPGAPFEAGAIAFLAQLRARDPAAYERARARLKKAHVRVGALDEEVERRKPEAGATAAKGRALELPEIEPWEDPVNGAALLGGLVDKVREFVALGDHDALAVALWIVHAHAHDSAFHSPRLAITSPTPCCGKSSLLRCIGRLAPRPLATSNISAPALFRIIETAHPTMLVDEIDQVDEEKRRELVGIINSSHCRLDACVIRTVAVGDDHEPRAFSTWAPIALAAIGRLPITWIDRSIVIRMKRRAKNEPIERMRLDRDQGFAMLARKCARWAADHAHALRDADPATPPELNDRGGDNWRHALAIADRAGNEWPRLARAASVTLSSDDDDGEALGVPAARRPPDDIRRHRQC
jgi:hypothetical protein